MIHKLTTAFAVLSLLAMLWPAAPVAADDPCGSFGILTHVDGLPSDTLLSVYATGENIYVGSRFSGLGISTDGGATWQTRSTAHGLGDDEIYDIYRDGTTLYVATRRGLSISTDGGVSFTNKTVANGLGDNKVYGVFAHNNLVYAATDNGLSISTNGGDIFTNRTTSDGLGSNWVHDVTAISDTIYVGTFGIFGDSSNPGGLSISTNGGASFSNRLPVSGLGSTDVNSVLVMSNTLYAGTSFGGLSISTNDGLTFTTKTTADGLPSDSVMDVAVVDGVIYAGTTSGLAVSTNGGQSFVARPFPPAIFPVIEAVSATQTRIYLALQSDGLAICYLNLDKKVYLPLVLKF